MFHLILKIIVKSTNNFILPLSCVLITNYFQLTSNNEISNKISGTKPCGNFIIRKSFADTNYFPLTVGDRVPDITFKMLNYSSPIARLSDFSEQLIILDFWATWCSSCVNKFSMLDSIQRQYKNQVKIILVNSLNTGDNEQKIRNFFVKRKNFVNNNYELAIGMEDSLADKLFPHTEVPHYAWINRDHKVVAITGSHEVTMANIEAILKKGSADIPQKKDFFPGKLMNLGETETPIDDNLIHYSFFKKGKLEGQGHLNKKHNVLHEIRGIAICNASLIEMYREAILQHSEFRNLNIEKRILIETTDSSLLMFKSEFGSQETWEKNNFYTYDLVIPPNSEAELYNYMINDLNKYTGFFGRIEKRKVKCFELIRTSKLDKIRTKGGNSVEQIDESSQVKLIRNLDLSHFVIRLDFMNTLMLPIIDKTGYKGKVDLEFKEKLDDIEDIRQAIRKYDLDLIEKDLLIDIFVLSKK